jgi:hypothetical protein
MMGTLKSFPLSRKKSTSKLVEWVSRLTTVIDVCHAEPSTNCEMTLSPVKTMTWGRAFVALAAEICRAPRIIESCSWFSVAPASLAPEPSMVCAPQNEARRTAVAVNLASVCVLKNNIGYFSFSSLNIQKSLSSNGGTPVARRAFADR